MNEDFRNGFEKIAGFRKALRKGVKYVGALTGVRQFRTARKQLKRLSKRDLRDIANPANTSERRIARIGEFTKARKRLMSGVKRMAVTGGIRVAAGLGTGGYLLSKSTS